MPGGYVSFSADELFVGAGLYMPMPEQLQRFRAAVADDKTGRQLEAIVATLRKAKYDVGARETLKTAPKGVDKDHPRIELLRQKGIVMSTLVARRRMARHEEGQGPRGHRSRRSPPPRGLARQARRLSHRRSRRAGHALATRATVLTR